MGRDSAEDLAQEVLLVLERKYRHVEALEELLPLSLKILRFRMSGARRTAARRGEYSRAAIEDVPLADPREDPEEYAERKQREARLVAALAKLEGRCRELFRLKLEGRSFAEIREILKAGSINTVYTWDFRCRGQLLELMGGKWL